MPAGFTDQLTALVAAGIEPDTGTLTRALYSSDASLYRVPPAAVCRPGTVPELVAIVDAARTAGLPLTMRGAGTSIAGNAVGPGLVLDCSRLDAVAHIDAAGHAAIVEPGVVPARLTAAVARHGLRFGPDPSTSDRCTIGGMIGNNACGPRALGYGRTSDNVLGLEVITGSGERLSLAAGHRPASPALDALEALVRANLGAIRTEFGRFPRQVSGYSLEHLLPEHGFDVARFLVGSEGTLAVVTGARLRLVTDLPHAALVVIGYPSMAAAADAMPRVLPSRPTAVEGLDSRIVDVVRRRQGAAAVPGLPVGEGWLFIELTDTDPQLLELRCAGLVGAAGGLASEVINDRERAARLWRIRADGAGLASVGLGKPAHSGWEDAAVPPEALGAYLRDLDVLLERHGLHGLPYGHFGEGCVHLRIDFELSSAAGVARYRSFVEEAAVLAAGYGGSMSGEHGDGRSELLGRMYSSQTLALFAAVKHIFDPQNLLNPGVLVDPRPLDADLRLPAAAGSSLRRLDDRFAADVHRCTGVGKCLAGSGTMCPSYQATGREQDSTRGRARVLQEMVNGSLVTRGWRAPEVAEALDLCLSCKACASECPTGTDVAAYKSRVLDEAHRHRLRPRSHYALGWLPTWGRAVTAVPGLATVVNAILAAPGIGRAARWLAGVDQRRSLPRFASRRARSGRQPATTPGTPVVVWVDSFTDTLDAERLEAVLAVLVAAGHAPSVLRRTACCGLPWITTGQRDHAARLLRHSLELLHPIVAAGTPVVGLEPSCVAVWRSDAAELVDDPRVAEVAAGVRTLAEVLAAATDWEPPDLTGTVVVAQPHCHHSAVLGWGADAALLARTGARVVTVEGCCGLAGNFGVERGHYGTSVAVANTHLLPAVEAAGPDAVLLADGFSCRLQLADLADRRALTLAELLTSPPPTPHKVDTFPV